MGLLFSSDGSSCFFSLLYFNLVPHEWIEGGLKFAFLRNVSDLNFLLLLYGCVWEGALQSEVREESIRGQGLAFCTYLRNISAAGMFNNGYYIECEDRRNQEEGLFMFEL